MKRECGPDTCLRQQVDQMLQDHGEAGCFLSTNALDTSECHHALPAEAAGAMIGRYKLLEQIGEGGCGVVWMAEQTQPVRRRVALKVIKLGMDTRQVIARFEAERQALALMDHPNISKVLDAGATGTGRPYFVMELVRGIKITDYCDRNHLPTGDRLALFNQVCQAIQHAHLKGIIHRDIKPSNILVTLHDGVPVPRVIDFGISKATTGQRLTDKTLFTSFEQFIGTPAYMSPEQAQMSGLDIDTRSDIYSLGVLLYELLTGRTPFDAKNLMAAGLDAMRRIIREEEPVRPSTCLSTMLAADQTTVARQHHTETRKLTHYLRGDLDWIVMKALEKDRTRRYETASALALDIQSHLKNEPVLARPPSTGYRFRKLVRRNRLAVFSASAVIIALVAGLGVASRMFIREKQARERSLAAEQEQGRLREKAEKQERKAVAEATKSRQVAQLLTDMLQGVNLSVALGRDTKLLKDILDESAVHIAQELKEQPEVEADMRTIVGEVFRKLEDWDRAREMHQKALAIRKSLFGNENKEVAASLHNLANTLPFVESEVMNREALALRRKLLGNEHEDVAESLVSLTLNQRMQNKFVEGEIFGREAVAITRKCFGNEHPRLASSLLELASVVGHQGRAAESEKIHREVLAMRRKLLGEIRPEVAESYSHLTDVTEQQSKWEEAIVFARQSLEIYRKLLGGDHPIIEDLLGRIGLFLANGDRVAEAEATFREALALKRKRIGDDHHSVAVLMQNIGEMLIRQKKKPEAETIYRESLAIYRKLDGNEHQNVAESQVELSRIIESTGKFSEAEAMLRDSLTIFRKTGGDEALVAGILHALSRVCMKQQKFPEAEAMCRESLAMMRTFYGDESRNVAVMYASLATIHAKQNRLEEAEVLSRQGLAILAKLAPQHGPDRVAGILILARTLRQEKKYAEGEALCREAIAAGHSPQWSDYNAPQAAQADLAHLLTDWAWDERAENPKLNPGAADRAREAERLLRACSAALQNLGPAASWKAEAAYSRLFGGALVAVAATNPNLTAADRESKFKEAEKVLLYGDTKMQLDPGIALLDKQIDLARLVRLYKAWGRTDKAAVWQRKCDEIDMRIAQLKIPTATESPNNTGKSAPKGSD